jgi:hypothetical protein
MWLGYDTIIAAAILAIQGISHALCHLDFAAIKGPKSSSWAQNEWNATLRTLRQV